MPLQFKPSTLCGKVGSFLQMIRSLQYRTIDQLYVLVSTVHNTTLHDKAIIKPE